MTPAERVEPSIINGSRRLRIANGSGSSTTQVNALHATALTPSGTPGGDFFTFEAGLPPAAGLKVAVTTPDGVASAAPGQGTLDGSVADAIAGLGVAKDGPDAVWSAHVTQLAVRSSAAGYDAVLASTASTAAFNEMLSTSAVSLDEETVKAQLRETAPVLSPSDVPTLRVDPAQWAEFAAWMTTNGLITKPVDASAAVTDRFLPEER